MLRPLYSGLSPFAAKLGAAACLSLSLGTAAWAQGAAPQVAYAPAVPRAVGEITLVVGPVVKTAADGTPESVQRGSSVMPGDRLDTAEGGMVHVRFIDGAMVSLRPGSRLWVQDYRYDPQQVANSLVRFRLDKGVARAISGAAAEGAKERFRLNTPLVAIGVRGTDFVVRTSEDATSAAVNQGAIVMAPFDSGCLAQALGPCTSPGAKLLSADMGHLLVEFRPQLTQPEIRPAHALAAARPESADVTTASVSPGASSSAPARAAPPSADEAVAAGLVKDLVRTAAPATIEPAPPALPEPPPQLMWGRWSDAPVVALDFTVPRAQAREGRAVTVGDSQYVLYRNESAGSMSPGLGAFDFTLQQSQAQFNLAGQVMAAAVQSGQLNIDFANRSFRTSLNVSSVPTGVVALTGAGFVRDDGLFVDGRTPGTAIAGAAALDGKSAGYLFEKAAAGGTLSGITLWSRK